MLFDFNGQKVKLHNRIRFVFYVKMSICFFMNDKHLKRRILSLSSTEMFSLKKKIRIVENFILKISSFRLNFNLFRSFCAKKLKR